MMRLLFEESRSADIVADSFVNLRAVTTHIFVNDSPYLDSDTVFGVKESLIYDFAEVDNPAMAEEYGVPNPFRFVEFDVVLSRDSSARG
jgi:hypothetical protein